MGLAQDQARLAAALTGIGSPPPGFDTRRFGVARDALMRKRARLVERRWPALVHCLGTDFEARFATWAMGHSAAGGLVDGWRFARSLQPGDLSPAASFELASREAGLTLRDDGSVVPRRLPRVVRTTDATLVGWRGKIWHRLHD